MGIIQFVILLVQAFPAALKAIQAWEEYHGQKLTRENRARLAGDIKTAVQAAVVSRDTAGLEGVIKNLGKPAAPLPTPDPKNPS